MVSVDVVVSVYDNSILVEVHVDVYCYGRSLTVRTMMTIVDDFVGKLMAMFDVCYCSMFALVVGCFCCC